MSDNFVISTANAPLVIPIPEGKEPTSLVCTPNAGTYSVEYSCTPKESKQSPNWVPDPDITGATTQKSAEYGKISFIRVTLTAGTSVSVDVLT